jgi:hypothetical protein
MNFPISLPGISFNLTIGGKGKEKETAPVAASPLPVGVSSSMMTLDGKDAALLCMGLAMIFLAIATVILSLRAAR